MRPNIPIAQPDLLLFGTVAQGHDQHITNAAYSMHLIACASGPEQ